MSDARADSASQIPSNDLEEQRALEETCGITVNTLLGICTVVQALPICLRRGSIRRRGSIDPNNIKGRFAVHHLIPIVFATHDILWRMSGRWDQNDPVANGIPLPTSRAQSFATKLPYHAGPHPQYSRCVERALDSMAEFRDGVGWNSDQLLPLFSDFVSDLREAVVALPPGSSVNDCQFEWGSGRAESYSNRGMAALPAGRPT